MTILPQPEPGIFISHSSKDNAFGMRLVQDLCRELGDDAAVWYDSSGGLTGGDVWTNKIIEKLTACPVFILIISPDAMNSKWVRHEFNMAFSQSQRKRIIPVLYCPSDIWPDLKVFQYISFLPPKTYAEALKELLIAVRQPTKDELTVISSEPTLPVATINQPEPVPGATPPMGRSRRLKQRLQELQAQYDVLSKNIARLRIDLASQAPGALRLQLERDIERAEEDRAGLEREIEGLERETTSR